jgi:cytoskeletal protein RodZ
MADNVERVAPPISSKERKELEKRGEAQVRLMLKTGGIVPTSLRAPALWWIAEIDEAQRVSDEAQRVSDEAQQAIDEAQRLSEEERRKKDEAFQAEQTRLNKGTLKVAIGALALSMIALVVSIVSWLYPLR